MVDLIKSYAFNITFDSLFSIFLVTNLVVFFWRIIWDTQDLYLTTSIYLNSFISIAIYFLLIFFVKYKHLRSVNLNIKDNLKSNVTIDANSFSSPSNTNSNSNGASVKYTQATSQPRRVKKSLAHKIATKLFILVFALANINHWRGVWYLTTTYTNDSSLGALTIGACSFLLLVAMQRVCVLIAIPFQLNKDSKQAAYQMHVNSLKKSDYLNLDSNLILKPCKWLFTLNFLLEYIADVFTIQMWRSLWVILDKFMFSGDDTISQLKSAYSSLLIGLLIYLIIHVFNKKIRFYVSNKNRNMKLDTLTHHNSKQKQPNDVVKVIFLNFIFLMCFIGTVNAWRGLWMLQGHYCYPTIIQSVSSSSPITPETLNKIVLNIVYLFITILVLWSINLVSSLLSRANCQDGYFLANKVLRESTFKTFFYKRRAVTAKLNESKHKWKILIYYYLLCNRCNKNDTNKIVNDLIYKQIQQQQQLNMQQQRQLIEQKNKLLSDV